MSQEPAKSSSASPGGNSSVALTYVSYLNARLQPYVRQRTERPRFAPFLVSHLSFSISLSVSCSASEVLGVTYQSRAIARVLAELAMEHWRTPGGGICRCRCPRDCRK